MPRKRRNQQQQQQQGNKSPFSGAANGNNFHSSNSWRDLLEQKNEYFSERYGPPGHHHSRNRQNHHSQRHHSSSRHHHSHHHHHNHQHHHHTPAPLTKEQWVLANYAFLTRPPSQVNNTNESLLRQTENDPDCLIEWKAVEIVRYRTEHVETCPICLDEFRAPRCTKCGHVFCYPCILRYLSDSEYPHRKCPMCNESVAESHLKPVQFESISRVKVGSEIDLLLMKRNRNSLVIYPANHDMPPMTSVHPILGATPETSFNRYCVTYDIGGLLQNELNTLQREVQKQKKDRDHDVQEVTYLEMARERIAHRLATWNDWAQHHLPRGNPVLSEKEQQKHYERYHYGEDSGSSSGVGQNGSRRQSTEESSDDGKTSIKASVRSGAEEAFGSDTDNNSNSSSQQETEEESTLARTIQQLAEHRRAQRKQKLSKKKRNTSSASSYPSTPQFEDDHLSKEYFFFYQSIDGNSVYLDTLCSRMLASEHGGFSKIPPQLHAKITHLQHVKVDYDNRRRMVFAKHLPQNCEVTVLELDMKPLVSESTYQQYQSEIDRRLKQREVAAQREKVNEARAKRRAREEEQRRREKMEREKFLWRDKDFPRVDEFGRELVPDESEFVPLSGGGANATSSSPHPFSKHQKQSKRNRGRKTVRADSQWSKKVHPSLSSEDFGPSLGGSNSQQQNSVGGSNGTNSTTTTQTQGVWGASNSTPGNGGVADFPSLGSGKKKGGGKRSKRR